MPTTTEPYGKSELRIESKDGWHRGVVIRDHKRSEILEDDNFERLRTRLRNLAGTQHPDYVGFDGARKRFLEFFPAGFGDPAYFEMERRYKLAARDRLIEVLPLEAAESATPAQAIAVRRAFNTNILSRFELARMHSVLGGSSGADFVMGAAKFTNGHIGPGIAAMVQAIKPKGRASWPMITYLPNLWRPDRHMFLKPEKTKDFATRVGHAFAEEYDGALESRTYACLLDLVETTEAEIQSLHPRDRIDVQSFIWVVGDYGNAEHAEIAQAREGSSA